MIESRNFEIQELGQAGEVRRMAMSLARRIGFDEVEIGRIAIVVTEAVTNMVKHGQGGNLLLQPYVNGKCGIVTLALDRGPGMARLTEMMSDGYSTAGSMGTGLGAISRQSSRFDLYSVPGKGTALFAGIGHADEPDALPRFGGVCIPVRGEDLCGDGWATHRIEHRLYAIVSDGLGHGPQAHEASEAAIAAFREHAGKPLETLVRLLHEALRPTRGASLAVMEIDVGAERVRYCGVGNISARIISGDSDRSLVSSFGTPGHDFHRAREYEHAYPRDATLVIHSDGLSPHWGLSDYPGLVRREPALIAGVLYRDHARPRDDVTVVVVRNAA